MCLLFCHYTCYFVVNATAGLVLPAVAVAPVCAVLDCGAAVAAAAALLLLAPVPCGDHQLYDILWTMLHVFIS